MADPRRLMAVLAHPDDETMGFGGALARSASEGVETHVVCATRGERGRFGDGEPHPGPEALGRIREAELRAAARELGIHDVRMLDYMDGDLARVDAVEAIARIVAHLRRVRPQVVLTFDPFGAYGHPDHIAISQLATSAVVAAACAGAGEGVPHRVDKLYYMATSPERWAAYERIFRKLVSRVDGVEREANAWPGWSITTRVETAAWCPTVWKAVQCHRSQIAMYRGLDALGPEMHLALWGSAEFYRAMSLVNGGRDTETSLFEGLG